MNGLTLRLFAALAIVLASGCAFVPSHTEKLRAKLDSDDRDYVFVTMHRGDWRHAPENSVGAIEGAIALGADIIELDVSPTKDGHYVLLHDGTLDRVSNGKGSSKKLTLEEIKRYRLKDENGKLTDYEILTLEEAFALTKGRILVNLDKYDRDVKGITECAIRCGVAREIVFKSGLRKAELKNRLGADLWRRFVSGELYYMPIVVSPQYEGSAEQTAWETGDYRVPAFEICFKKEPAEGDFSAFHAGPAGRPRIWVNTLWDSLCAGHTDERGYRGDTAGSWGWCLERGCTMIQTDRPKELIDYLKKVNRR